MEKVALGRKIRELRKVRGVTGKELAARTGISAAAISKFETGQLRPNESLIEKVIEALALPKNEANALQEVAALFNSQFQRWSITSDQTARNQEVIGKREKNCKIIRCYMNQIVHGLLQSETYMRAVFKSCADESELDGERLVQLRKKRQGILKQKQRSFVFVLHEMALRTCLQSPEALFEQLDYLEELIDTRENLEIRVLPMDKPLTRLPLHHFTLYDERTVSIEMLKGELDLWTEEDVRYHIDLMNYLVSVSLSPANSKSFIGTLKKNIIKTV